MPDDSNAREMEAALNESDEPEIVDGKTRAERLVIEEEAMAEEEFVADQEDTVNPLIYDQKKSKSDALGELEGAFGSEGLADEVPVKPINNEEELRKESVNEDNLDPTLKSDGFDTDSNPDLTVNELSGLETELSGDNEVAMSTEAGNVTPEVVTANTTATDAPLADAITSETMGANTAPADVNMSANEAAPTMSAMNAGPAENAVAPENAAKPTMPEDMTTPESTAMPETATTPTSMTTPEATIEPATVTPTTPTTTMESMQAAVATTPQPIPAGMPTSSTPAATTAPALGAQPKKKKTGLIISLIVLFVLLVGGAIFGVIWYNQHEAPERQVGDAIENLLSAPILGATSSNATTANGNLPMLSLNVQFEEEPFNGDTLNGGIVLRDANSFYFRTGDVSKIVNSSTPSDVTEEQKELADNFANKITEILSNKWIAVKLNSDEFKDYECLSEASNNLMSETFRSKVAELYHANEFVSLKEGSVVESRNGVNYYEVEIDEDKSDAFGEALEETSEMEELSTCVSEVISGVLGLSGVSSSKSSAIKSSMDLDDEDEDYDLDDYWDDSDSMINTSDTTDERIFLGVTPWTHELKAIEIKIANTENNENIGSVAINFESISESELDNAKDIKSVVEDVMSAYNDVMGEYMKYSYREVCEEYEEEDYLSVLGYDSVDKCVDAMMEYYNEYDNSSSSSVLNALGASYNLSDVEAIDDFNLLNL